MIESVRAAFTLPDLRRRILFTIGIIIGFIIYQYAQKSEVP